MILVILVVATILRIFSLNQSLWLDEAINVLAAKELDFITYISRYTIADFHPPGYFAILWGWTRVFGFSEIAVRIPSVLFALGTIWFTYLTGSKMFSKRVGLISALLLSLAPLHIYYSQEARMYSFAAFAATLSMYFFINFIERKKYAFLGYSLSISILLYTDYVTYFILPVQAIHIFLFQRQQILRWVFSLGLGIAPFLPWLSVFPQQLANGQQTASSLTGWRDVVGGTSLKDLALLYIKILFGRISIENKTIYAVIIAVLTLPYLVIFKRSLGRSSRLLMFWLLIPPLLAFLVSFYIPVFSYFRFIFILPAFYLLLGVGIEKLNIFRSGFLPTKNLNFFLVIFVVTLEIVASLFYLTNSKFHREDWRGAGKFAEQKIEEGSIVLFESDTLFSPYLYYTNNPKGAMGGLSKVPAFSSTDVKDFGLQSQDQDVYLFEYLVDITDPKRMLEEKILLLGYKKSQTFDFRGVGFVHKFERM